MNSLVRDYLFSHTYNESQQLKNHQFITDIPQQGLMSDNSQMVLLDNYFLKDGFIYISKHPRFAQYPQHRHRFIEMNYVYSGKSRQIINGNPETIKQGEFLLLDRGSTHSLEIHHEDDILINLIFAKENIGLDWFANLNGKNSLLFDFVAQDIASNYHQQYVIFHSSTNQHLKIIMEQILEQYFTQQNFSNEIISLYMPILFTELIGKCPYSYSTNQTNHQNNETILKALEIIEKDYANLTLTDLANRLGYNKNYLSNLIKSKTKTTFTDLLTRQKMKIAKIYLENTKLTITSIMERIGISNRTYFYQKFTKLYQNKPTYFRNTQSL